MEFRPGEIRPGEVHFGEDRPGEVRSDEVRLASWTGKTIDRISEGRIVESWANWDMMGMMQQLGAIPNSGQAQGS